MTPFNAKIQQKTNDRQYGAKHGRPLKFAGGNGIEHFKGEGIGASGNIAAQHKADAHLAHGPSNAQQKPSAQPVAYEGQSDPKKATAGRCAANARRLFKL